MRSIERFTGAGGLALGLDQAGFDCRALRATYSRVEVLRADTQST